MDPFTLTLFLTMGFLLLYHFLWQPMNYFKQRGIKYESPVPIFGNMASVVLRRTTMAEHFQRLYHRFSDVKYFGLFNFTSPVIVIRDPDLIASITVKNFDHFSDRRGFDVGDLDPLIGRNLSALRGDEWREMRRLLSPSFTSMKMKIMYHLMRDCANDFTDFIANQSKHGKVFDIKDIFGRYTTDVIATCSFGISIDSMRNPNNEFYVLARDTMSSQSSMSWKLMLAMCCPALCRTFGIRVFSEKVHRYFLNVVRQTVKMREEQGITRPDMIQLMMDTKDKERSLTIEEMTNQAFVFFLAGYDTSSTFLSFLIHEIATHPEVKAKLMEEIEEVVRKTNGNPTYDALKNMPYMDAVMNETLRLDGIAISLDRVCVKEFQLEPASSGAEPVTLKPGDIVWFLPFSLQRDSKYVKNPTKFDPDRFLGKDAPSPSVNIPFGIGPRICIGNRFALLESKILMFYLLWRCDVEPCEKTQVPMKFSKHNIALTAENGFWLKFRARDKVCLQEANGKVKN
nr:cytochrome P450 9e2-like [Osmia lignaria]